MKRAYVFGTALALALTGSVYAQQDQSAASSGQKDREVTVTGCLVPGAPGAGSAAGTAGTSGSSSATTSASKFMLANASITSGPGATSTSGTTGTSGSAGAASSAASGSSYNLIGGDSSDLDKNVNSKVEVRGVIEPASSSSAAGGSMTGGTSGATGAAAAKQLRVTSVRQLASSCSGGQ